MSDELRDRLRKVRMADPEIDAWHRAETAAEFLRGWGMQDASEWWTSRPRRGYSR
jgi:hypothetical protein